MHRLQELIDWAAPRYRYVTKTFEGFDALQGNGNSAIVYCRGTLSGGSVSGRGYIVLRLSSSERQAIMDKFCCLRIMQADKEQRMLQVLSLYYGGLKFVANGPAK